MGKSATLTLAFFMALISQMALAQDSASDSDKEIVPAHCTLTKAMLCKESGCAASDTFGELKLPTKVSLDFTKRVLLGVDTDGFATASTLDSFAVQGTELIGYGVDQGSSWVVHADASDRTVTLTVSSDHTVLTAFGSCVAAD